MSKQQLGLWAQNAGIVSAPEVQALLGTNAPVAFGVSGGNDSALMVFETTEYLDRLGHRGPRICIHADLGTIEHADSRPACERIAAQVGLELISVQRQAGDMLDRWEQRQHDNVARYASLSCVKLILPWSTAGMRFCTKEMKTAVICADLVRRFPGQNIVSAVGLRREESSTRAKKPIWQPQDELRRTKLGTNGISWYPILDWLKDDRDKRLAEFGYVEHEAYRVFGMSRVSCSFCILSSMSDMVASANDPRNLETFHWIVGMEIRSTFGFHDSMWLADVRSDLLTLEEREGVVDSKRRAGRRRAAEARIPKHLEFTKGWPTVMPTQDEAELLAEVRQEVAAAVRLEIGYLDASHIVGRYAELMESRG